MIDDPKQIGAPSRWPESARGLSDANWRVRRQAVNRLKEDSAEEIVQYLLRVLRDEHRDLSQLNGAIQVLAHTPADVVPRLLELLQSADADVRSYVALTLGERGDPRAIDDLVSRLSDADSNVRTHIIEALGKLGAGAAVDAFIEWIDKRDFAQGFPALDALVAIGDLRITHHLYPLLTDPMFKIAATEALGELGDEQSIRPILTLLSDREVEPRTIVRSLVRLDRLQRQRYGISVIPREVRLLVRSDEIHALIVAASAARERDAGTFANALSWLPGNEIDTALVRLLECWPTNEDLIEAMVARTPQVIPQLIERMATASIELRQAILQILARSASEEAIPALLEAIETEKDEELVGHAIDAITKIGDRRLYSVALRHFGHPSATVRHAAVTAVSKFGNERILADLKSNLEDPSALVRESAVKAAAGIDIDSCRDLIIDRCADADEQVRRTAIEAVAACDSPRAIECLSHAIRADTPLVRAAAAGALSKYADELVAAQLLISALRDDDVWVRYFAIRSLASLNRLADIELDLQALASGDPAMQVRIAALEALGLCGKKAFPILAQYATSTNPELASAAITALPRTGHEDVYSVLVQLTKSDSNETRALGLRGLAALNDLRAVAVLRDIAVGRVSPLWREAVAGLATMTHLDAAWALIEAAAWPRRRGDCIAALISMSDAAVPALARGLQSSGLDTRRAIVEALARIQTAQSTGVLETALNDPAPAVRHGAASALRSIRHVDRTTIGLRGFEGGN